MVKICWLGDSGIYGAGIYNRMAQQVLSKHYKVDNIAIQSNNILLSYSTLLRFNEKLDEKYDIIIRGFHGVVSMIQKTKKAKNIAILQFLSLIHI